uniref:NAC transcription factor n=1 Tax=Solanum tuberosum TaxID=4113 RepID=M1AVF9_SOLTU
MDFLVNAVKAYFDRSWSRKDMMSLARIPQNDCTSLNRMKRVSLFVISAFFFGASVETSECSQNKTWLMVKYHVADSFFKENNHILKEDFVVCRMKKKMDKEKNVDYIMEAQDGDVAGINDPMLLEPNHNNDYSATEDEVRVCDEEDAVEATTSEYDVQNSTYEATTMENKETTRPRS